MCDCSNIPCRIAFQIFYPRCGPSKQRAAPTQNAADLAGLHEGVNSGPEWIWIEFTNQTANKKMADRANKSDAARLPPNLSRTLDACVVCSLAEDQIVCSRRDKRVDPARTYELTPPNGAAAWRIVELGRCEIPDDAVIARRVPIDLVGLATPEEVST